MLAGAKTDSVADGTKRSRPLSYVAAFVGLILCFWSIWSAARMGLARLSTSYAAATNLLSAADEAIGLSPSDPDAHYVRAVLLSARGDLREGLKERAASLRPLDYVLWLRLGRARDEAGETEGALSAFREAVRLAPAYAQPHWQLGNLLLRAGRREEAFGEMRLAAASRPQLLPNFIDLAWNVSQGDALAVERIVRPETDFWRLTLARFFIKRGKTAEAFALFRAAGEATASTEDQRTLLVDFLAARQFPEAYQIWKSGKEEERQNQAGSDQTGITDGNFENGEKVNEPGFGWQLTPSKQMIRLSLDQVEPRRAGSHSLLIDWSGNSDVGVPVLSQLVVVEPQTRYQLSFAFRTKHLTSGGPPLLVVQDASSQDAREMARSTPLPKDTVGWQEQALEFTTGTQTRAVLIKVIRQNCTSAPCPVFGQLWLDDFSLKKL